MGRPSLKQFMRKELRELKISDLDKPSEGPAVQKANKMLGCNNKSLTSRTKKKMALVALYSLTVRPYWDIFAVIDSGF